MEHAQVFTTLMNTIAILAIIASELISIRARSTRGKVTQSDLNLQSFILIPVAILSAFSLLSLISLF